VAGFGGFRFLAPSTPVLGLALIPLFWCWGWAVVLGLGLVLVFSLALGSSGGGSPLLCVYLGGGIGNRGMLKKLVHLTNGYVNVLVKDWQGVLIYKMSYYIAVSLGDNPTKHIKKNHYENN
jgi:hypothetical protein